MLRVTAGGPAGFQGPDEREAAEASRPLRAAQGGLLPHHLQLVPGGVCGQRGERHPLQDLGCLSL